MSHILVITQSLLTKKLLLVDGNAIIHRAFHALPPFTTSKGEMTNAVFGFSSMLLTVLENIQPEYAAMTFDMKGKTFRNDMYVEYKATRSKAPQELYDQIPRIKEVVKAFDMPIFELEGYEADDIIGTLATQARNHKDLHTFIATGDMDSLQLVNDRTFVVTPHKGFKAQIIYNEDEVFKKYELKPEQLKDYKGLKGDSSDNIPGVRGVGDKTAVKLLKQYQSLEGVYENLDEITGSIHVKLSSEKEKAFLSKKLGTILTEVPVELKLDSCKVHNFDLKKIQKVFMDLEFRSLQKRLTDLDQRCLAARSQDNGQQQLF